MIIDRFGDHFTGSSQEWTKTREEGTTYAGFRKIAHSTIISGMAFIEVISPDDATGDLADIYRHIEAGRGKIASVHTIQSLNPPTIQAHMELYRTIMFSRSPLSRAEREMIAVVVSRSNECRYCVAHHGEALLHFWKERERVNRLVAETAAGRFDTSAPHDEEPGVAITSPRETALCRFARMITKDPGAGEDGSAVTLLRSTVPEITDREILDATLATAYFNFVNRIVLTLGVELEQDPGGYRYEA